MAAAQNHLPAAVHDDLITRIRARSPEIEAALAASILEVHRPPPAAEAELIASLRATLRDGLEFSFAAFEHGEAWDEPLPRSLVDQVAYVVQVGMPLDALLRGYTAGNTVISRFVAEECADLPAEALTYSVEVQSRVADALIGGLSAEYAHQASLLERSSRQRAMREVERLLAAEPFVGEVIDYLLDRWHIAGVVSGPQAEPRARLLAERLGCDLLLLPRAAETHWAWWGRRERIGAPSVMAAIDRLPSGATFALGSCRRGEEGFRLSHREARFSADIAVRTGEPAIRGADAILPALLIRERSTAELFLDAQLGPLKSEKDWPMIADTLRAYLDAGSALGAAAATLGVDRHTVSRRVRRIERLLERPLTEVSAELEIALRVESLIAASPSAQT